MFKDLRNLFRLNAMIKRNIALRPCTVAQDQGQPAGHLNSSGISDLHSSTLVHSIKNVFANLVFNLYNAKRQQIPILYAETAPGSDSNYANLPYGTVILQLSQSGGSTTDATIWIKTANGYESLLTSTDADWFDLVTVTTIASTSAATLTSAQIEGGLILRDPAGAARSDVTPTAALIVAGIPAAAVGSSVRFHIKNTADANETITVTAGSGVTLNPTTIKIKAGDTKEFIAVCTNVTASSEAVTIYDLASNIQPFIATWSGTVDNQTIKWFKSLYGVMIEAVTYFTDTATGAGVGIDLVDGGSDGSGTDVIDSSSDNLDGVDHNAITAYDLDAGDYLNITFDNFTGATDVSVTVQGYLNKNDMA